MSDQPIMIPGADHPIDIAAAAAHVTVRAAGRTIADTRDALVLREAHYGPVLYVPRRDVDMARLQRSSHRSYCPYKGECCYYSIPAAGEPGTNAAWSYEQPHPAVAQIRDYLAFYPQRVDAIESVRA
ncbi:MAG TPA: DUF427 domain-containing protein [Steroidobacteraceae bacterium]|nr:DUF427 domain-containing protein [Steroidobacteraceae bacterium]